MNNWYKEAKKKKQKQKSKKKQKHLVDPYVIDEDGVMKYRLPDGTLMIADENEELEKESKKKKDDWDPNPWAVCHTTVDKDKDPKKYERCVQKVKKKQKNKKKSSKDEMVEPFPR